MEQSHDIEMYEFQEELNFEIVRVVYEWASGMVKCLSTEFITLFKIFVTVFC